MVTLMRSVAELTNAVRAGSPVKFLFFWGHQPQRDGSIGAGCLSQWWPASFSVDGREFPSAEHYMMWRKAILFGDEAVAAKILTVTHPHAAKTLGRQVEGFDEQAWERHRYDIVVAGAVAKFGQHQELREYLVDTGERVLVEASPVDRLWGIGLAVDHPHAIDPARWRGLNLLGFALMQARTVLAGAATRGEATDGALRSTR
ncbi:NADAR family protein [Micromonospora sp. LH3U1]|uniref:NADAR family protein n=1 Tax=Micromonospora sp. LH3U1 TaxID=3018339 RepID=UPI0023499E28|nr:NADAR family protein [Micromonospora sp. LH3U1]WCN83968.1 NADAR family protein [Micromonospora sp. LH3U1]